MRTIKHQLKAAILALAAILTFPCFGEDPPECPPVVCTGTGNCPLPSSIPSCSSVPEAQCNGYEVARKDCKTGSYAKCVENTDRLMTPRCIDPAPEENKCGFYECADHCSWDTERRRCVTIANNDCANVKCAEECWN